MQQTVRCILTSRQVVRRYLNTNRQVVFDAYGIPLKPVWSVHELLSSYPTPEISNSTLQHLHHLSALIPPEEGSERHHKLKKEMRELVKLVEAVKLVNTDGVQVPSSHTISDDPSPSDDSASKDVVHGQDLLKHSSRTVGPFYVVDADRAR